MLTQILSGTQKVGVYPKGKGVHIACLSLPAPPLSQHTSVSLFALRKYLFPESRLHGHHPEVMVVWIPMNRFGD